MSIFVGAVLGGRLARLDTLSLVWQASWLVQLVLLLLLLLSVFSWAIILVKWRELRRAEQDSEAFLEIYQEGSFDAAYQFARELDRSPLASIFLAAYGELNRMLRLAANPQERNLSEAQGQALTRQISWAARERACGSSAASPSWRPPEARRPSSVCSARCRHHRRVPRDRPRRLGEPGRGGARHRRGPDRHGGGAVRGDSGHHLLQLLRGRDAPPTAAIDLFTADCRATCFATRACPRRRSSVGTACSSVVGVSRPGATHQPPVRRSTSRPSWT